jgi:hypothetical protein
MNHNPTLQQLRDLLASQDDHAGHHVLWVTDTGEVRISRLPKGPPPPEPWAGPPEMKLCYETFWGGYGYVGPQMATDEDWAPYLFENMVAEWAKAKVAPGVTRVAVDSVPIPERY